MKRREFLTTGLAGAITAGSLTTASAQTDQGAREYYELRVYQTHVGPKKNRVVNFWKDAGIPAMNRIGVGPVGVFNVMYGQDQPSLYVLLVHPSLESVATASEKLLKDEQFQSQGAEFIDASLADPTFVRYESSLMVAFSHLPKLQVPPSKTRIFEMRTYESHSLKAARKKIEMFNEGGEIAIFKKTGLMPVFFGETIIGRQQPNLVYTLTFENMRKRDEAWEVFGQDPDWKKLRSDPAYKDTVSNISDIILRPAGCSQI